MANEKRRRGPWYHGVMVWGFSIVFALLIFWFEGFVISDLGDWPGPDWKTIEESQLDPELVRQSDSLSEQMRTVDNDIKTRQEQQRDLRDSTNSAETTMNRLLEIQKLAIEKDIELTERETQSLAEAKDLFLSNQKQYQQINREIADLRQTRRDIEYQHGQIKENLDVQRTQANVLYQEQYRWHEIKMAAIKLAVLIPLLIVAVLLYFKWSKTLYVPLIYAFCISTAVRAGFVMHEHFPTRYFKYILIAVAIIIVVWVLVQLIRRVARPANDWLIRQYREAYERMVCPVCDYPIRRGPMRYRYWNRRTVKKLSAVMDMNATAGGNDEDDVYVCPSCATPLYEQCDKCGKTRPTLLRACPHCGTERDVETIIKTAMGR